ncbi:hypothetical protein NCLIV_053550 [Neospora caninum Liverpool]|uniref:Uncharacterized protein n=1 Tax=Neospora caninum (strain Liverpool) TaxID=572307 RepID=F0VMI2_NEOCL|nr:hypothetical protein NCLIV_053550 [Neospora caninum Liverpool]CBZ54928.1 hypothetical protein NCLIV_053550 [Neospora caninum Liverpool]|eukprot:XP_003884956.1 hypothetical protein NCLIV_053550 [Neospora caninum Liverpool]
MPSSSPLPALSEAPTALSRGSVGDAGVVSASPSAAASVSSPGDDSKECPGPQPSSGATCSDPSAAPSSADPPFALEAAEPPPLSPSTSSTTEAAPKFASTAQPRRRSASTLVSGEDNPTPRSSSSHTGKALNSSSLSSLSSSLSCSSLGSLTSSLPGASGRTGPASSPSLDEIRARLRSHAPSHPYASAGSSRASSQNIQSCSSFPALASLEKRPGGGFQASEAPRASPTTPTRGVFSKARSGTGAELRLFSASSCSASQPAPNSVLDYLTSPSFRPISASQDGGDTSASRPSFACALPSLLASQTRTQASAEGVCPDAQGGDAEHQRKQRRGGLNGPQGCGDQEPRDQERHSETGAAPLGPDKAGTGRETDWRAWGLDGSSWGGVRRLSFPAAFKSGELEEERKDFAVIAQELLAYLEVVETFRQRAVEESSRLRQYSGELGAMLQQANQREEQSHRELARQHKVLTSCQARVQALRADSETAINDLTVQRDTLAERLRVTSVELEHALKENERIRLEREAQEISVRDVEALRLECSKSKSERNSLLAEVHHLQNQLGNIEETVSRNYPFLPSLEAAFSRRPSLAHLSQTEDAHSTACASSAAPEASRPRETAACAERDASQGGQTYATGRGEPRGRETREAREAEEPLEADDEVENLLRDLLARAHAASENGQEPGEAQRNSEKLLYLVRKLRSERNEYYGYAVELLNRLDAEKGDRGASAPPTASVSLDEQVGDAQVDS